MEKEEGGDAKRGKENVITLSASVGQIDRPGSEDVWAHTVFVVKYVFTIGQVLWFCQTKALILCLLKIKNENVVRILGNH